MDYEIAVVSIQIRSEVALESCQEWTEIEQLVEINPSIIPLKIPGWFISRSWMIRIPDF